MNKKINFKKYFYSIGAILLATLALVGFMIAGNLATNSERYIVLEMSHDSIVLYSNSKKTMKVIEYGEFRFVDEDEIDRLAEYYLTLDKEDRVILVSREASGKKFITIDRVRRNNYNPFADEILVIRGINE